MLRDYQLCMSWPARKGGVFTATRSIIYADLTATINSKHRASTHPQFHQLIVKKEKKAVGVNTLKLIDHWSIVDDSVIHSTLYSKRCRDVSHELTLHQYEDLFDICCFGPSFSSFCRPFKCQRLILLQLLSEGICWGIHDFLL